MEPAPAAALSLTLLAASITDFDRRRIPNALTGSAAAVAVVLSLLGLSTGPLEAGVVALLLGLPLAALATLKPEGFGMGDAKLAGVMALFMGWEVWFPLVLGLGFATLYGGCIGLARRSGTGSSSLPLAPFLAFGTVPFAVSSVPLLH